MACVHFVFPSLEGCGGGFSRKHISNIIDPILVTHVDCSESDYAETGGVHSATLLASSAISASLASINGTNMRISSGNHRTLGSR